MKCSIVPTCQQLKPWTHDHTAQENHVIVGTDSDLFRGDCRCLRMFVVRRLSVSYLFAT